MSHKQGIWKRAPSPGIHYPLHPSVPFSAPSISPPHSLLLPAASTFPCPFLSPVSPLAPCPPDCAFPPAQPAAPQERARLTGASTSSMEQPSSRSLKVSPGMLRGRVPSPAVPAGSVRRNGARCWERDRGSRPSVCTRAGAEVGWQGDICRWFACSRPRESVWAAFFFGGGEVCFVCSSLGSVSAFGLGVRECWCKVGWKVFWPFFTP